MSNNIIKYLKQALGLIKNKGVLFRYTEKINFNADFVISILNSDFQTFRFSYSDELEYIGIDKCIEYQLHSKKELKELKELINVKLPVHSFGENINEDLKVFGGVAFNMNADLKEPWDGIPSGLFIIPKILITKKNKHYFISYYHSIIGISIFVYLISKIL